MIPALFAASRKILLAMDFIALWTVAEAAGPALAHAPAAPSEHAVDPHADASSSHTPATYGQAMARATVAIRGNDNRQAMKWLRQAWSLATDGFERSRTGWLMAELQHRNHNDVGAFHTLRAIAPLAACGASAEERSQWDAYAFSIAWQAGLREPAYRLLEDAYRPKDAPPTAPAWGLPDYRYWTLEGAHRRLRYALAGMTFPSVTPDLVRASFRSADTDRDAARVTYVPLSGDGPLGDARVHIEIRPVPHDAGRLRDDLRQSLLLGWQIQNMPADKHGAAPEPPIRAVVAKAVRPLTGAAPADSLQENKDGSPAAKGMNFAEGVAPVEPKRHAAPESRQGAQARQNEGLSKGEDERRATADGMGTAAGAITYADDDGHAMERGAWLSRGAHWEIVVQASWPKAQAEAAEAAVGRLTAAIRWRPAQAVFQGDIPDTRQRRQAFNAAMQDNDWDTAAELAGALLPDTVFPNDTARLYSAQTFAAVTHDHYPEAFEAAQNALKAWRYSRLFHTDEHLYGELLLYAASAALKSGHAEWGKRWVAAHSRYIHDGAASRKNWAMDDGDGTLTHLPFGVRLPTHLGAFVRQTYTRNMVYYIRLHPRQVLGISFLQRGKLAGSLLSGLADPLPGHAPAALAHWMRDALDVRVAGDDDTSEPGHIQNRRTLDTGQSNEDGLSPGSHRPKFKTSPFDPASTGPAKGTEIRFNIVRPPSDRRISLSAHPAPSGLREMGFWLSRLPDGNVVLLRSEWGRGDLAAYETAQQAAAAFPWPKRAQAIAPPKPAPSAYERCTRAAMEETREPPAS